MAKKTAKNRSFFSPLSHVFVRCDETVKDFWKIFSAITTRVLHLSENVLVIVQNRPVFSITWLNGASKKSDFEGNYLANGKSYGQSLYVVPIGNPCVPIGNIARIWPWMTLNRDTEGSNFRPSPFSRPAADLTKISVCCTANRYPSVTNPVNFVSIGRKTASQLNKICC